LVVQDFEGVAVEDGDDGASPPRAAKCLFSPVRHCPAKERADGGGLESGKNEAD
jgi:hypothetical protein